MGPFFYPDSTVLGVLTSVRPPVVYVVVSVFYLGNARIEPTSQQVIDETCTCMYSACITLIYLHQKECFQVNKRELI